VIFLDFHLAVLRDTSQSKFCRHHHPARHVCLNIIKYLLYHILPRISKLSFLVALSEGASELPLGSSGDTHRVTTGYQVAVSIIYHVLLRLIEVVAHEMPMA